MSDNSRLITLDELVEGGNVLLLDSSAVNPSSDFTWNLYKIRKTEDKFRVEH